MAVDIETINQLVKAYANDVRSVFPVDRVILFGSHAKGTAHADSDIDIAVILNGFTGDYLETSKQLYRLRRNISADIEPVLLDSSHDESGFVAEVFRTGQVLSARPA